MSSDLDTTLRARDVHVSVGEHHLLRGIDLDLAPGLLHVIVGPSGAGKSMLIRALTGTLPPGALVAGSALLHVEKAEHLDLLSADAATFTRRVYGRRLGIVPQSAATSFTPVRTLRAHLTETVAALHGAGRLLPGHPHLTPSSVREHVDHLAATVGLDPDLLDRYPHQVSGGQIRRAAVAAALAGHPPLLLADEPVTGLDEGAAALLAQMLRTYAAAGHGALLVTHDIALARTYADVVSVLDAGQIVESGRPATVLDHPQHPTTRALVAARLRPHAARSAGSEPGTPVLRLREVSAGYGGRPVIEGVDLSVHPGQVLGVTGPSGSGKSTLAAVAALMHRPAAGSVEIDGQIVHRTGARVSALVRRRVGWVQQEPRQSMDPRLSLHRAIVLPQRIRPSSHGASEPVEALAEAVGLAPHLLSRRPAQVSGGELQRAAVARALALHPGLLVCDEITAMLDAASAAELVAMVARLARTRCIGVLLVSHDLALLRAHADTVVVVDEGRARVPTRSRH